MWSGCDRGPFERVRVEYITTSKRKKRIKMGMWVFMMSLAMEEKERERGSFGIPSGGLKLFKDGILMLMP